MQHDHKLVPAPKARRDYMGGASAMTEWRWRQDGILPAPIQINRRNFYRESDLLAIPERAAKVAAEKERKKQARSAA